MVMVDHIDLCIICTVPVQFISHVQTFSVCAFFVNLLEVERYPSSKWGSGVLVST